jgi:hypothetical protein
MFKEWNKKYFLKNLRIKIVIIVLLKFLLYYLKNYKNKMVYSKFYVKKLIESLLKNFPFFSKFLK